MRNNRILQEVTNMDNKNDIINKVRKVLSLAHNNPNQHEGETAMLHAQKLMAEHSLQISEVTFETVSKVVVDEEMIGSTKLPWWYKKVATVIAKNFRCSPYTSMRKRSTIRFIGLKEDIVLAKEVYLYAIQIIYYNSDKYMDEHKKKTGAHPMSVKNTYILGFIAGLSDKFEEQIKQHQEWGLVLVKDPEVQKKVVSMHLFQSRGHIVKQSGNFMDREAGYTAGKNFNMIKGHIGE